MLCVKIWPSGRGGAIPSLRGRGASRFLFTGEQLNQPVERFSGGEHARVLIARLMLQPADVLILDLRSRCCRRGGQRRSVWRYSARSEAATYSQFTGKRYPVGLTRVPSGASTDKFVPADRPKQGRTLSSVSTLSLERGRIDSWTSESLDITTADRDSKAAGEFRNLQIPL
jgi:hypothetical protein